METTIEGKGPPLPESLVSYVPPVVARRLAERPEPIDVPTVDVCSGACLLLDVVGFTPLAERLARKGAAGAEEMAAILNDAFGPLVSVCSAHGGEIMEFEGDSLLVVWWGDEDPLDQLALRATACGLALQRRAEEWRPSADVGLSMKVVVAAGPLRLMHVGGFDRRKRCVMTGIVVAELGELEGHAARDEVIISGDVADLLAGRYEGERASDGRATVHSLRSAPVPRPVARPIVPPEARAALLEYVPARLEARLAAGREAWLAEFRRVSSVFVNLIGLRYEEPGEVERLSTVSRAVEGIVDRFGGSLEMLAEGAKGTVLRAAFGLPPGAHEDDPARAVRAALEIEEAVTDNALRCAIGISTGSVFSGPVGGPERRELTVVGDVVNLAARLMQSAEDDILCDGATAHASDRIQYDELPALTLKGKEAAVPVFRPQGDLPGLRRGRSGRRPMVGRRAERALLAHALERLDDGAGGVLVVEGEAGIGKSRLVEDLIEKAEADGIRVVAGSGDAIEASTPYYAWRPILWDALELASAPDNPGARRRHVLRWFRTRSLPVEEASLLNDVLGLRLPEDPAVSVPTAEAKAERTRALLGQVLIAAAGSDPIVIAIEDAHWLDSASWGLVLQTLRGIPEALLVLASRSPTASEGERGEVLAAATRIVLDRLDEEDTLQLVCRRLGVERLADDVRKIVLGRAEGHPFFSEELALSLRDAGVIVVEDGAARIADPDADLERLAVPDTVHGVITSRIDQLEARQQLLLKVASVFGRAFELEPVRDLFPAQSERRRFVDDLGALEERGLVVPEAPGSRSYTFRHAIIRDVAYASMLHAQRRDLHRAAARWLEDRAAERPDGIAAVLAHHWLQAAGEGDDDAEALRRAELHLSRAGVDALRQGAFVEAERFLTTAFACYERLSDSDRDPLRELGILRPLTTASFATHGFGSAEVRRISQRTYELARGRLVGSDLFPILWALWIATHFQRGGEAIALGEQLMEIAEGEDDDELRLQAHHALWTSLIQVPDYERARGHIEAGIRLYRPEWHERHCAEYGGHDPGSCAQRAAALTAWTTGMADQAVEAGREAVRLAQDHAFSVPNAMLALAFVHRQRGDLDAVTLEARALRARAMDRNLPVWVDWAAILEAWARGRAGDIAGGIEDMEGAAERLDLKDPGYMAMLAELYALGGRTGDGLRLVEELLEVVERTRERSYEPELHRLRGELLLQEPDPGDGPHADAERHLRGALQIAGEQGALSFSLRASTALARLLSRQGRPADGAALLRATYNRFSEGFGTADLVEARSLLAELE